MARDTIMEFNASFFVTNGFSLLVKLFINDFNISP